MAWPLAVSRRYVTAWLGKVGLASDVGKIVVGVTMSAAFAIAKVTPNRVG